MTGDRSGAGPGRPWPPPLRLGVLAPGTRLARWQRCALEQLLERGDVELVVLVLDGSHATGRSASSRAPLDRRALWRLYNNRWVRARARSIGRVECADVLADAAVVHVVPERVGRYSQRFPPAAIEELRTHALDALLRFGFGILRGEVLDVPRHGIWSFHHDDERVIRGGPPSFWEVHDGLPTTGVLLQRLTDELDAGVPLARATFRTVGYSYPRNRDRAALGAAVLPAQVARAVRRGVLDPGALPAADASAPIRRDPDNRQMIRFLGHQTVRAVSARVRGVVAGAKWNVGVVPADGPALSSGTVAEAEWLPERRRGYYADPFPATRDGTTAVLVEDFDERSGVGVISALRRDDEGRWSVLPGVIAPGQHASYPSLVEVAGQLYCVPETARLGRVEAWRCMQFPDRWERAGTLLEVPVVDPTVVEWGGRWWLFGGRRDRDATSELWLWSAPSLFGPWSGHPQNPVKLDVTSSRSAGTPFELDGVLHRPAQDCSSAYGGAIVINAVVALDEERFEERPVGRIEADGGPYPLGRHTLSYGGGLLAIDGKRLVIDPRRSRRELVARLRRR